MRTIVVMCVSALVFMLLISGITFACSGNCVNFRSFQGNIIGNAKIEFKPFTSITGNIALQTGILSGGMKLNYNTFPKLVFQNMDLGKIGLTYKFTMPQPRFESFSVPRIEYRVPLREILTADFRFDIIQIKPQPCEPCCEPCPESTCEQCEDPKDMRGGNIIEGLRIV